MMLARFEPIEGRRKMPVFTMEVDKPALRHVVPVYSEGGPCVCTPPPLVVKRSIFEPRICKVVFEATGETDQGVAVYRELDTES